jgi:hypothetical protein
LTRVALSKDQSGVWSSVFERSVSLLAQCVGAVDTESLWYALARSAELGFGHYPIAIADQQLSNRERIIEAAAQQQPRSARIMTLLARERKTVSSAREALALDPSYAPAIVALASATANDGDAPTAFALLERPAVLETPGAQTLRAQILLSERKLSDAIAAARLDVAGAWAKRPEPIFVVAVRRAAEETLGLCLMADGQTQAAAGHLRSAAGLGSTLAAAKLESMGH